MTLSKLTGLIAWCFPARLNREEDVFTRTPILNPLAGARLGEWKSLDTCTLASREFPIQKQMPKHPQNSGRDDRRKAQRGLLQGKLVAFIGRLQLRHDVQVFFASLKTVTISFSCVRLPAECQEAEEMDEMQSEGRDRHDGGKISRRRRSFTSQSTMFQRLQNIGEGFARKAASATELLADRELRRYVVSQWYLRGCVLGPFVLVFLDIFWQGCTPAGRRRLSSAGELVKG